MFYCQWRYEVESLPTGIGVGVARVWTAKVAGGGAQAATPYTHSESLEHKEISISTSANSINRDYNVLADCKVSVMLGCRIAAVRLTRDVFVAH